MLTAFKTVLSQLKYLWLCICYNIKSSVSNKKSFIVQTIAMFINNSIFILFWGILFVNKGDSINGVVFKDLLYLWSIPTIGYGITFFCFGGIDSLCRDIADGNLDIYLTKPKSSLVSQLTSRSVLSAMGDLFFGIACGLLAVDFNIFKFLIMIILSIISAVLLVSILSCIRLLSFWLGDISNSAQKYTHNLFITLTIYPEEMFPKVIKIAMYTVVPAVYVAHVPIRILKEFSLFWVIVLIAATIFFVSLMLFLYNKGLKKYESGNAVTRR